MSPQSAISALGRAIWLSMPFFMTLALSFTAMAPAEIVPGFLAAPNFAAIGVFFWAIYAPQFFPPAAVFALGLSLDLLGSGPIGFWTLLLLALYGATLSQRAFFLGRSVTGVWAGFAGFTAVMAITGWGVQCAYYGLWANPWPAIQQTLVTAALFPLAARLFFWVRRLLTAAPERTYS